MDKNTVSEVNAHYTYLTPLVQLTLGCILDSVENLFPAIYKEIYIWQSVSSEKYNSYE